MVTVFTIVYEKQRPVLRRIEEIYGPLNMMPAGPPAQDYDPIFDDPEFQSMDRLMRQVPKGAG